MNKKNCNGYEAMFTFLSEEDFSKHIEECEDCCLEHQKMQKVSELIKEAKPYLNERRKRRNILKAACAMFVVFVTGAVFQFAPLTGYYSEVVAHNSPSVEEMGLPVDEYGFLKVD